MKVKDLADEGGDGRVWRATHNNNKVVGSHSPIKRLQVTIGMSHSKESGQPDTSRTCSGATILK